MHLTSWRGYVLIAQDIGIALVLRVTDISVKKLHILSRLQRVSARLRRALDRVGDCDAQRGRYPGGTKSRGALIGRRLPSPDGIQQTRLHNLDHFLTTRKDA
jgi:hypothetical protein